MTIKKDIIEVIQEGGLIQTSTSYTKFSISELAIRFQKAYKEFLENYKAHLENIGEDKHYQVLTQTFKEELEQFAIYIHDSKSLNLSVFYENNLKDSDLKNQILEILIKNQTVRTPELREFLAVTLANGGTEALEALTGVDLGKLHSLADFVGSSFYSAINFDVFDNPSNFSDELVGLRDQLLQRTRIESPLAWREVKDLTRPENYEVVNISPQPSRPHQELQNNSLGQSLKQLGQILYDVTGQIGWFQWTVVALVGVGGTYMFVKTIFTDYSSAQMLLKLGETSLEASQKQGEITAGVIKDSYRALVDCQQNHASGSVSFPGRSPGSGQLVESTKIVVDGVKDCKKEIAISTIAIKGLEYYFKFKFKR